MGQEMTGMRVEEQVYKLGIGIVYLSREDT